ncbi:MYXO-CTERM domain-containing protein [Bradymonas sediminis]|uniref:Rhamnogalacturonase A/B/Epimerase-like pectate lyase domain-containing protein n=2 Tax=Bradymonas sediminis TaxID=1548548 RepID=A0A2Z4FRW6_9DELT|nr:hypothetical protein DN745_12435 [Bradymonas sediminis]TDP75934.1 MYXO-CTERM domain-containing protein [Bradymonas sediminis]
MRNSMTTMIAFAAMLFLMVGGATARDAVASGPTSALWGEDGELFTPGGRLMDWSYAGYGAGERAIPDVPVVADVAAHGAVGDGVADDGAAIEAAIDAVEAAGGGAVYLPPGRYLSLRRFRLPSGVVLRGAGQDATTLYFPEHLESLYGGDYSFGGAFIEGKGGSSALPWLTTVVEAAERGTHEIRVASTERLAVGDWVMLAQRDLNFTLIKRLHSDLVDASTDKINDRAYNFPSRIEAINGDVVTLERALIADVETRWTPTLRAVEPRLSEIGVESLTIEFPVTAYPGHLNELGYNAVHFNNAWHAWVRDVRVLNADLGVSFTSSFFCTASGVTLATTGDRGPITGHHGLNNGRGGDNLFIDFDIQTTFQHDLTNEWYAHGVVFARGRGDDLCMDHHRAAPHSTLWTELNLGAGTRPWMSGGSGNRGPHTASWDTMWNVTADQRLPLPWASFGPQMTFVGFNTRDTIPDGALDWYVEPPALVTSTSQSISPANLWEAMVARRLPAEEPDPGADAGDTGGSPDAGDAGDVGDGEDGAGWDEDVSDVSVDVDALQPDVSAGLDAADEGLDATSSEDDVSSQDATSGLDGVSNPSGGDGCGCRASGTSPTPGTAAFVFIVLAGLGVSRCRGQA